MEEIEARGIALEEALRSVIDIQAAYGRAISNARDILVRDLDYTPGEAVLELFARDMTVLQQTVKVWSGLQKMFPDIYGLEMQ
jgi:hypothetical protein